MVLQENIFRYFLGHIRHFFTQSWARNSPQKTEPWGNAIKKEGPNYLGHEISVCVREREREREREEFFCADSKWSQTMPSIKHHKHNEVLIFVFCTLFLHLELLPFFSAKHISFEKEQIFKYDLKAIYVKKLLVREITFCLQFFHWLLSSSQLSFQLSMSDWHFSHRRRPTNHWTRSSYTDEMRRSDKPSENTDKEHTLGSSIMTSQP